MELLVKPVTVWTGEEVIDDAAILIRDGNIAAVGPAEDASSLKIDARTERINGTGRLAVPGLINAHTHLYSSLARGMPVSPFHPTSFTQILEQLWWKLDKALDPQSIRASALVGAMEAARCGVTTLIDHHASPNAIPGSLDLVKEEVCGRLGLRGTFCYELSDRDGPERSGQGIEENLRFLGAIGNADPFCSGQFGLHASFTVEDETLERAATRLPDGVGIHIHVAEGPEDEVRCQESHGMRIAQRLDRFGLLRPTSILAHCLHIDEAEKDLVAERDAVVVHNPRSNMNNAVGLFDMAGFLERGILTGLGTDGLGANMLAELFTAGILQKHSNADPLAGPFDALDVLLFRNNPRVAGRLLGVDLGRLVPGAPADIALLDYTPPTPLRSENALGHLLFGTAVHSLRVTDLLVAGKRVLSNGAFVDVDEEAVYAHAREQAQRLWDRLG
jgi:putative selenium metabolism protein SsnA